MNKDILAFPLIEKNYVGGGQYEESVSSGMTLRDYFAGQALTMGEFIDSSDWDGVAVNAYKLADAMLKEREK